MRLDWARIRRGSLGFLGVVLALLAIGSVTVTAHSNHRQRTLIKCGVAAVQQTVAALQARDAATINANQVTLVVTNEREKVINAIAVVAEGRETPAQANLDALLIEYHKAITDYEAALQQSTASRSSYPLPDDSCLRNAIAQANQE